jgi:hypothetical protein
VPLLFRTASTGENRMTRDFPAFPCSGRGPVENGRED